MDNLLINDTSGEFYFKDKPLLTLNNFKTINLFVGANNTRKSRLMRRIAQMEQKVVFKTVTDIADVLQKAGTIIERLKIASSASPDLSLLNYTAKRNKPDPQHKFAKIQDFFDKEVAPVVRYSTFTGHIEKIITDIPLLKTEKEIEELNEYIERFKSIADLFAYVYGLALDGEDITSKTNYGQFDEINANAVQFTIPDRDNSGNIKDLEFKMELFLDIRMLFIRLPSLKAELLKVKGIYIPVLRSSRNLVDNQSKLVDGDVFASTINLQYFNSATSPQNVTVHTGQEHYKLIDQAKRGKKQQREDFAQFESFIGKSFYQSAEIEIIPYQGGKYPDIIVSLPNERPDVPIHDLGDGVQAIINLFFPIFTAENGTWIFIDEPELNLHPGFQNLFIRTLLENAFLREKELRYFINSHSNHILSEVLLGGPDRSEVYVFQRKDENSSDILTFDGYENATLDLLGVLNTSTLISNCSVWVEGVTDRLYLRAFLSAFLKVKEKGFQPIEGLNYSFIEYGGKNLVHYIFDRNKSENPKESGIDSLFINRNVFLLADTDTKKDQQHARYRAMETEHFKYGETGLPEIENLLPPQILAMYLEDRLRLSPLEASKVVSESYQKVKLGKFLAGQFKKLGINKKIEAVSGGTLSSYYKSSLAEYVLQQIQLGTITWSMLAKSSNLREITIRLYEFIAVSNNQTDDETISIF